MQEQSKKAYTSPQVVTYGSLNELTLCTGGSPFNDVIIQTGQQLPGPDSQICGVIG